MDKSVNTGNFTPGQLDVLAGQIKAWGRELGFAHTGITALDLSIAQQRYQVWLDQGYHGEMDYMARHASQRAQPSELLRGAARAIVVKMNYLYGKEHANWIAQGWADLAEPQNAAVSCYARGRDYHKVVRARLATLCTRIAEVVGPFGYRSFTDSAPVMEVELASQAGLGWRGKHTLLLSRHGGSMFFLGEILVDLPLPVDEPEKEHCGRCQRCLDICPTRAIIAPYLLDARRCIAYLTIELKGSIPEEFRSLIGNRIFGCDDCQLVCPWNKYAEVTDLRDFASRGLHAADLCALFLWSESEFLSRCEGSAIRRIGHLSWLRNIAVALGNALRQSSDQQLCNGINTALQARANHPSPMVREHVQWALVQSPTGDANLHSES